MTNSVNETLYASNVRFLTCSTNGPDLALSKPLNTTLVVSVLCVHCMSGLLAFGNTCSEQLSGQVVDVAEVFRGGRKNKYIYSLRCMVCYYGLHYHAFVKDSETNNWRMFDDTRLADIGDWKAVQQKCHVGRIQPSILFYEAIW